MLSRVRLSRRSGVIAEAGADFHSPKVAMRRADEARPDHERRHPPSPQPTPHHYTGTHTTRHRTAVLP